MKNILWFREIHAGDIPLVGGKGANLGEMTNANFPIPPGFVITAQAYFNFLKETEIENEINEKENSIDVENTEQLQRGAEQLRNLVASAKMSEELEIEIKKAYRALGERQMAWLTSSEEACVAVRSSATAEDLPSISENEHVLVKINGKPMYDKIGKIYEKLANEKNLQLEVPGMKGNKVEWLKAESIFRHKANNDTLFKIITKSGREIVVSPNHTIIALDEDLLEPKTIGISEVGNGTKLPVTASIPELNYNKTINVLDYAKGADIVEWHGLVMVKNNSNNWNIQNGLPKEIRITEDFAYFLGHYLAEGSTYKNNLVSITNSNNKILHKIENILRKLGIYKKSKINKHSIRAYCPSLVRFLHETCGKPLEGKKGKGKLCATKRVPDFVFGWNKKNIGAFLRGCFDGDGTISKDRISYCTISEMLAGGIIKLLEILEIGFYTRRKKNAVEISIPIHENKQFAELIDFEDLNKKERLAQSIKNYKMRKSHPEFKYSLTISEELTRKIMGEIWKKMPKKSIGVAICKKCGRNVEPTSYYKNKKRYYCKNCGTAMYENEIRAAKAEKYVYFDEKGQFKKGMLPWNYGHMQGRHSLNRLRKKAKQYGLENLFAILDGTVKWDDVKEVAPIKYDGWVYDFVVPEVENFAAGFGGIITHNSASFAGQQETFLNIRGGNELVDAVKRCWASLFTARAIYYRRKNNFSIEKVGIAVVVQKMVSSGVSGVMFTAEPMGDRSRIIIESVFGLGETIVSGAITPDHYVVDKGKLKILEKNLNEQSWMITRASRGTKNEEIPKKNQNKQKLTDRQIIEIAKIGKQIENHYNFPQDIEFAIEGNVLYVVQSRAITTLKTETKEEKSEEARIEKEIAHENAIASGLGASPGIAVGRVKIIPSVADVAKLQKGEILVTRMTSPDWVPTMRKAAAIVTNEGGLTCHAAIVSRELGIPCIVGTENATEKLQDGMIATVDGYSGKIYGGEIKISAEAKRADAKAETSIAEIEEEARELKEEMHEAPEKEETPKEIAGHRILVKVNVALPEAAERAAATGADGVGLLRAEHMITASGTHPAEFLRNGQSQELKDIVKNGIRGVAVHFKNKPVWYRTFDARSDEFRNLKGGENEPHEDNPMLGWHGIRRDLDEPELLRVQFQAIKELREEGFNNVGIMLPFVQSAEEFRRAKEIAKEIGLRPEEKELQFGVMIETPASVWVIDELIREGTEFISFGTNDLTQLTLGIDRNNERIQKWFSELHPAVLMEAKHVIERCKKAGVETSICGQAGSNPEMVKRLVVFGIDSVSANIDAVELIRKVIAEERRQLAEQG